MRTLFLSLLLLSAPVAGLVAQTMHIILVINTQEQDHGRDRTVDRTADYTNMRQFFSECAQYAGMTPRITHLGQSQFNSASVKSTCSNLNVVKGDAIVFYFSGHGGNDRTGIWPVLDLKDGLMPMAEVIRTLRGRNASFLMVLADCCNSYYTNARMPPVQANPQDPNLYRQLFYVPEGKRIILASASKPGEDSISIPSGAIWGAAFREAVRRSADNSNETAEWGPVLELSKHLTQVETGGVQNPQGNIIVSLDPFEDE